MPALTVVHARLASIPSREAQSVMRAHVALCQRVAKVMVAPAPRASIQDHTPNAINAQVEKPPRGMDTPRNRNRLVYALLAFLRMTVVNVSIA